MKGVVMVTMLFAVVTSGWSQPASLRQQLESFWSDVAQDKTKIDPEAVQKMQQRMREQNVAMVEAQLRGKMREYLGMLGTQTRVQDPFGLRNLPLNASQDESGEAVNSTPMFNPFEMALQRLPVDGIDAERREVFVGVRSLYEGDTMVLSYGNQQFQVKVVAVRPDMLVMQNVETGAKAAVRINIIPPDVDNDPSYMPIDYGPTYSY